MKKINIIKSIALTVVVGVVGLIAGLKLSPKETILDSHTSVSFVDGRQDLSKIAFRIVNEQLPKKLEESLGVSSGVSFHYMSVVPTIHGYDVHYAAVEESPLWEDGKLQVLLRWIHGRMVEIHDESVAFVTAEQDSGGNGGQRR